MTHHAHVFVIMEYRHFKGHIYLRTFLPIKELIYL